jgi:hypothetical protein
MAKRHCKSFVAAILSSLAILCTSCLETPIKPIKQAIGQQFLIGEASAEFRYTRGKWPTSISELSQGAASLGESLDASDFKNTTLKTEPDGSFTALWDWADGGHGKIHMAISTTRPETTGISVTISN